jgi:hypothetical protein
MKPERKRLIEANDKIWSKKIKERDGCCQMCGTNRGELEAHHIWPRSCQSIRWNLHNGVTLCKYQCHVWAENHPDEFERWAYIYLNKSIWDVLFLLSNRVRKINIDELRSIRIELKQGR